MVELQLSSDAHDRKSALAGAAAKIEPEPSIEKIALKLPRPSIDDQTPDLERLLRELQRPALKVNLPLIADLPGILRQERFKITAVLSEKQLLAVEPGDTTARMFGLAFDIGTGTGVLAALLARRGVRQVVATDMDARALACAQDNLLRLGVARQVRLQEADLFPGGRAALLLCNPPWVPARASAPVERAVYDEGSAMLRGFLAGAAAHLLPGGEAWLVLSDLAEHLGLRSRGELLGWFAAAGLTVAGRLDIRPRHGKAFEPGDPLHAARSAELTSLWRLAAAA